MGEVQCILGMMKLSLLKSSPFSLMKLPTVAMYPSASMIANLEPASRCISFRIPGFFRSLGLRMISER